MDFAFSADQWVKIKESEKVDKNLDFARESPHPNKQTLEHVEDGDTKCSWNTLNGPQRISKGIGTDGNRKKNRDHPYDSIAEIGQNTEKSPKDLRGLAVTQTLVKDQQNATQSILSGF